MSPTDSFEHADDVTLLVHEALVYANPEGFVAATEPFLREGLRQGEAAFVATTKANIGPLRAALDGEHQQVTWVDATDWYRKPVDTIEAYKDYIAERLDAGAPRVRIVGEPPWPADPIAATEWLRYESILNLLLAPLPVWVVCPYDAARLDDTVLEDAHRTHPHVIRGGQRTNQRYVSPSDFFYALDRERPLTPAPRDALSLRVFVDTIAEVRELAVARAAAAGFDAERIRDIQLVASEMAGNAVAHGGGDVEVRLWVTAGEFVFEVRDLGAGMTDRLAGYSAPAPHRVGGWGLLFARRLCDAVEVRSGPSGTVVRVHVELPHPAHDGHRGTPSRRSSSATLSVEPQA